MTQLIQKKNYKKSSFRFITSVEYKKKLEILDAKKPSGRTDIPASAMKDQCNEIYTNLTFLLIEFLKIYLFPTLLKKHLSRLIIKKKQSSRLRKRQSISITGQIMKIFCIIKKKWVSTIKQHSEQHSIWVSNVLFNHWRFLNYSKVFKKAIDNNKYFACSLLDLSKALEIPIIISFFKKKNKYN